MTCFARLGAAVQPYFYRNHLFVAETGLAFATPGARTDSDVEVVFPFETSRLSDSLLQEVEITADSLQSRHLAGDEIGLVLWQNRVIHRSLLQCRGTASMEGDRNAFVLQPRERYIHSCLTSLEHRGKGLYAAMLRHILRELSISDSGLKVFIACRQENSASVRAIQRAGFAYLKSSTVLGFASGRVRYRSWNVDHSFRNPVTTSLLGTLRTKRHE